MNVTSVHHTHCCVADDACVTTGMYMRRDYTLGVKRFVIHRTFHISSCAMVAKHVCVRAKNYYYHMEIVICQTQYVAFKKE